MRHESSKNPNNIQFRVSDVYYKKLHSLKERTGSGTLVEVIRRALDALEDKLDKKESH